MTMHNLPMITLIYACLFSTSVFAASDKPLKCNANINSEIVFANNELNVFSSQQESIVFTATGTVFVDNTIIILNSDERDLAQRYFKGVEASIPMVVNVTVEAVKITDTALNDVFTELLGNSNNLPTTLNARINGVATTLQTHVYQDPKSLTFDSVYLKKNMGFGDELGQEIEQVKAEVVASIMGQLIMAVGQSMMNDGGDFAALEARMAGLAQNIEKKAKTLGESLQQSAADLCDKVEALSEIEKELRKVQGLDNLDTVNFTKSV